MKKQCLYIAIFADNSGENIHKIGITNDPDRRMRELTIKGVLDLVSVHTIDTEVAIQTERTLHDNLAEHRTHRDNQEWFSLPEDIIDELFELKTEHEVLDFCGLFNR